MSFGPGLGGQLTWWWCPGLRDEAERCGGVEALRQQIINRWVTEVREEYCAKVYRFMLYRRLFMVVEEEYIKNIRDSGYS